MDNSSPDPQKKGLGALAWLGIGCGGLVVLGVIGLVVFTMMFGGKIKQIAGDMQKNPTRATATLMVNASVGQIEMVAEDDEHLRYTVKEKQSGKLTTIYWNEKTKTPVAIPGDFSAIPGDTVEKAGGEKEEKKDGNSFGMRMRKGNHNSAGRLIRGVPLSSKIRGMLLQILSAALDRCALGFLQKWISSSMTNWNHIRSSHDSQKGRRL